MFTAPQLITQMPPVDATSESAPGGFRNFAWCSVWSFTKSAFQTELLPAALCHSGAKTPQESARPSSKPAAAEKRPYRYEECQSVVVVLQIDNVCMKPCQVFAPRVAAHTIMLSGADLYHRIFLTNNAEAHCNIMHISMHLVPWSISMDFFRRS